jgi:LysM repeat protein
MKKGYLLFIIYILLSAGNIQAQNTASGEEYIIQKDDTLWSISGTRLEDPFLWPKLWNINPHISNPDLIYPGEKIRIPSRETLIQQALPSAEETKLPSAPELKTSDTAAGSSDIEASVKTSKKYLVNKNFYISAGWISKDFPSIGTITTTPSGRRMAGTNDIVYINVSAEKILTRLGLDARSSLIVALNENSKNRFFTIRNIKPVKHPVTGEKLGYLIRITGILEIIGIDSNTPKAKIISSFEDIETGDGLMPYKNMEPPLVPDVIRTPKIGGHIVETHFTNQLSGENDILYLDKGSNKGLELGDVFTVFPNSALERTIGKLQVISLQADTSTAVLLKSSEEITIGSKWGQK